MPNTVLLAGGFSFGPAAAAAHIIEPTHARGVVTSRGLEEGTTASRAGELTAADPTSQRGGSAVSQSLQKQVVHHSCPSRRLLKPSVIETSRYCM
jgi:hypothetical protein